MNMGKFIICLVFESNLLKYNAVILTSVTTA